MFNKVYQVDSFTKEAFSGNPAGVCILDKLNNDDWMKKVANEMNLSETSFLSKVNENTYQLRWFTPGYEVDLCGHATLAAAHILWEQKFVQPNTEIKFETKSGMLYCKQTNSSIEMSFPSEKETKIEAPKELEEGLGVEFLYTGKNRFDYIVEVESEKILKSITPDFNKLLRCDAKGIIVTCKSTNPKYDFISRFFAPDVSVNEDPVTGSAHCCLAPYWSKKLTKTELNAYQASQRGGELKVKLDKDRVKLIGNAVTVLIGELLY